METDNDETREGDMLAQGRTLGNNYRSVFVWDKSAFKLIYRDVLGYYTVHVSLTLIYNFLLNEKQQNEFDQVSTFFRGGFPDLNGFMVDAICMISGFFLSMAVSRYFSVNYAMPGCQKVLVSYMYGLKSACQLEARALWIQKYSNMILLMWALTFRTLSLPFRRKYPTMASLQAIQINDNPLMNDYERKILENCERLGPHAAGLQTYRWCLTLLQQTSFQQGFLNPGEYANAFEALHLYKKACGYVMKFVTKNIPLAAAQAVLITIYVYGMVNLLGRPFNSPDVMVSSLYGYFPYWGSTIFFLFFSWVKVALVIAHPFGSDHQDIDCVAIFQDHMQCISDHVTYFNSELEQVTFMQQSGCGRHATKANHD